MKKNIILLSALFICISLFSGCADDVSQAGSDPGNSSEESSGQDDKNAAPVYEDGVYQGSGTGYGGEIPATVTIEGGKIVDITIGDHKEDAMYMDEAVSIIDEIMEQQNTDVDSVSGATASCVGIKSAVKKALAEAQE